MKNGYFLCSAYWRLHPKGEKKWFGSGLAWRGLYDERIADFEQLQALHSMHMHFLE